MTTKLRTRYPDGSMREEPAPTVVEFIAPVPDYVTNFQARAALLQVPPPKGSEAPTMFHHIDAFLRANQNDPDYVIAWQAWEFANEFHRLGATVQGLAGMFGLSEMIDDLFRAASQIEA